LLISQTKNNWVQNPGKLGHKGQNVTNKGKNVWDGKNAGLLGGVGIG